MRAIFIRFVLLLVLGVAVASGRAATPPPGFQQGNTLYAAGKYQEAATAYESAVQAGYYSANLFYNLGNAYDRLGERGRAILNYQRALLLKPGHPEARANLAFVQGHPIPPAAWLGVNGWTLLAAAAGWLGLICLLGARRPWRRPLAAALVCWLACAAAAAWVWHEDDGPRNSGRAIVLTDRTRALYSPADNSKIITTLAAGSEVRILSEQGVWVYTQLGDGSPAWLAAANVARVVPAVPSHG